MSDQPTDPPAPPQSADRRAHLRLVALDGTVVPGSAAATRPRTIGRIIAQTALIADSAVTRRGVADSIPSDSRGIGGRLFGRFR